MPLGVRTELVLHVGIMFSQRLAFLICVAAPLGLITFILLAYRHGEASVKLTIVALLCALHARNFIPISLLSDGEGVIAQGADTMSASI